MRCDDNWGCTQLFAHTFGLMLITYAATVVHVLTVHLPGV
jgi:hypothetical protein